MTAAFPTWIILVGVVLGILLGYLLLAFILRR